MTRALVALERGPAPAAWQAWLFSIARNHAVDQLRRRGRQGPLGEAEHLTAHDDARLEHRERLTALLADLERLPERQRSALVLREVRGLSDAEIGELLAISSAGVRQAVFEARTALKDFTAGREMACAAVLEMIGGGDRRRLRARQVRAHLRSCPSCHAVHEGARVPRRAAWWLPVSLQDVALRVIVNAPATSHEALAGSTVVVKSLAAAAAATTIGIGLAERPPVSGTHDPVPVAAAPPPAPVLTARPTFRLGVPAVRPAAPAAAPAIHAAPPPAEARLPRPAPADTAPPARTAPAPVAT